MAANQQKKGFDAVISSLPEDMRDAARQELEVHDQELSEKQKSNDQLQAEIVRLKAQLDSQENVRTGPTENYEGFESQIAEMKEELAQKNKIIAELSQVKDA